MDNGDRGVGGATAGAGRSPRRSSSSSGMPGTEAPPTTPPLNGGPANLLPANGSPGSSGGFVFVPDVNFFSNDGRPDVVAVGTVVPHTACCCHC